LPLTTITIVKVFHGRKYSLSPSLSLCLPSPSLSVSLFSLSLSLRLSLSLSLLDEKTFPNGEEENDGRQQVQKLKREFKKKKKEPHFSLSV